MTTLRVPGLREEARYHRSIYSELQCKIWFQCFNNSVLYSIQHLPVLTNHLPTCSHIATSVADLHTIDGTKQPSMFHDDSEYYHNMISCLFMRIETLSHVDFHRSSLLPPISIPKWILQTKWLQLRTTNIHPQTNKRSMQTIVIWNGDVEGTVTWGTLEILLTSNVCPGETRCDWRLDDGKCYILHPHRLVHLWETKEFKRDTIGEGAHCRTT